MIQINKDLCDGCRTCADGCPMGLIIVEDEKAKILDTESCMGCEYCVTVCPKQAIKASY